MFQPHPHRGGPSAGRLVAALCVWGFAAAVVLGTAAFTRVGPVIYVIGGGHGVHAFDALVAVVAFVCALLVTPALLRPRTPSGATLALPVPVVHLPVPWPAVGGYGHAPLRPTAHHVTVPAARPALRPVAVPPWPAAPRPPVRPAPQRPVPPAPYRPHPASVSRRRPGQAPVPHGWPGQRGA